MSTSDQKLPDYTYVSTLRMCARKFYWAYERNLRAEERVPVLVAGTAMHEGLEVWYKTADLDAAEDALRASFGDFTVPPAHKHDYLTPSHLASVLRRYAEAHADQPREIVQTGEELFGEKVFEFDWDGPVVGGKIDLVEHTDTGQLYVTDFKTSTGWINNYWARQRGFALGHQLRLYTAAVERELGEPVAGAYVEGIYIGKGASDPERDWSKQKSDPWRLFGPYTWSKAELEETRQWIVEAEAEIQFRRERQKRIGQRAEYAWPQNVKNAYGCENCAYFDLCDASPSVRDGLARARYVERAPEGRLASGADEA